MQVLSYLGIGQVDGHDLHKMRLYNFSEYTLHKVPSTFISVDTFDLAMFGSEDEAISQYATFLKV